MPPDPAQQIRLSAFSTDVSVDMHCHCLPALDDGPATMQDAVDLCRALVADGVTHAIATPHQLGPFAGINGRAVIQRELASLNDQLETEHIPLKILPGADIRIDEHLFDQLDNQELMTLNDGRAYVLLELPHDTLLDSKMLLDELAHRKICAILSHPERQAMIARKPERVVPWLHGGALLQITSASLLGEFGPVAESAAWRLLEAGAVSLVASDAHDTQNRPPRMTPAIAAIAARFGHAVARRLCIENPCRILMHQPIQPPRLAPRFGGRA